MVRKITPREDLVCPPNKATSSQLAEEAVTLAKTYTEACTRVSLMRVGCWKSPYCPPVDMPLKLYRTATGKLITHRSFTVRPLRVGSRSDPGDLGVSLVTLRTWV